MALPRPDDFPNDLPPPNAGNGSASNPPDAIPIAQVRSDGYGGLKRHLHQLLLAAVPPGRIERLSEQDLRLELGRLVEELARQHPDLTDAVAWEALVAQVLDEVLGFGPIDDLMRDHEISDILINGPRQLFIEKRGKLHSCDITFRDEGHLLQVVRRMIARTGRRVDEKSPMLDAQLPDGSRLNIVIKPPALNGPLVSIRRFGLRPLAVEDLLVNGSLPKEMLDFLAACVQSRISMIISGGTGSGKTTLLNALSRFIPASERVVTIEDTAELQLQQPHVAKMEAQPANREGETAIPMRDLVKNALRMRPDRIIVGECRGAEALEMLQAMNTGHEGSLTTVHANSTRDAISRIELMMGLAGVEIPVWAVRKLIAASVTLIVQVARLVGGSRKIVTISEITGMEGEVVTMHNLFEFVQTGVGRQTGVEGFFRATGIRPHCLNRLNISGADMPVEMFSQRRLEVQNNRVPSR
jgi:pilus assembly protein CpaF